VPFRISAVVSRIRKAIRPFARAMLFQIAEEEGHRGVIEQLVACMISVRTRDEVSLLASRALFALGKTPSDLARRSVEEIDQAICASTFHLQKAYRIREIAKHAAKLPGEKLPADFDALTALPGVGPKCAGLALGIAAGQSRIGVDVHVHRVTRRWGFITAATPEKAIAELEAKLPKKYWVEINELLVPFGKHICRGPLPKCSTCPVLKMCRQIGVTKYA
jgi:endonuclease-3